MKPKLAFDLVLLFLAVLLIVIAIMIWNVLAYL